jgi:hypothetical protein
MSAKYYIVVNIVNCNCFDWPITYYWPLTVCVGQVYKAQMKERNSLTKESAKCQLFKRNYSGTWMLNEQCDAIIMIFVNLYSYFCFSQVWIWRVITCLPVFSLTEFLSNQVLLLCIRVLVISKSWKIFWLNHTP